MVFSDLSRFRVTQGSMRPNSKDRECFYCHQNMGANHLDTCVLILKRVKIKMVVEYEIDMPASWDKDDIEFKLNESSWCASNAIGQIEEFEDSDGNCLCHCADFEFVEDVDPTPRLEES